MLCGDGDRDALRADDYTFSASSRTTYMASLLVFGTVISDAAMVDRVIGMDVQEAAAARDSVPRRDLSNSIAAIVAAERAVVG